MLRSTRLSLDRVLSAQLRGGAVVVWALALAVWVIAAVLLWPAHEVLLNWDEVDYVNAAQLGPQANALERGSLSPIQFVNFAFAKMSGERPVLPPGYDERRDPLLLRHYHPPFVVFLLSAISPFQRERLIRGVQLVGAFALTLAIAFSYRNLSGSVGWSGMLLVVLLTLWLVRLLFASVSFHGWAAVWVTTSAALLSRWLSARTRINAFFLCASLALTFLTLETGILVWAAAIVCLLFWGPSSGGPDEERFPWRPLVQGTGLTALFVVLVWPGSVIQASFLKIPALYAYRIWLGEEYAGVSGQWPMLGRVLVPLLVLGPLACLSLFLVDRGGLSRWGPFAVIGGLYGLALSPFALQPQYLLPALAPFIPMVGAAFDRIPFRRSGLVLSVVTLLMIGIAWPPDSARAWDRKQREDLRWLENVLRAREALVDGGHIYQYYLGEGYMITPITVSYRGDSLSVREAGRYRALGREDMAGKIVVIQRSRRDFLGGSAEEALLDTCSRVDQFTLRVYDCAANQRQTSQVSSVSTLTAGGDIAR